MAVRRLHNLKLTTPTRDERVDIQNINIDVDLPITLRAEQYLEQVKNPYAFRCADVAVNIIFSSGGRTLKDVLTTYFSMKRNG